MKEEKVIIKKNTIWDEIKNFILIILLMITTVVTIFIFYTFINGFPSEVSISNFKEWGYNNDGKIVYLLMIGLTFTWYFASKKRYLLFVGIPLAFLIGGALGYIDTLFHPGSPM